jgi:hypothetical protein
MTQVPPDPLWGNIEDEGQQKVEELPVVQTQAFHGIKGFSCPVEKQRN